MIMDAILNNLVQQTGVDVRALLPGRDDEYLLTYDDKLQACFSLRNDKGKVYYDSCAWSCGAACYITCFEGKVFLYSYLLRDEDRYELSFVESRWSKLFDYLKDVILPKTNNIFTYFSNFLNGRSEELLSIEQDLYLKSLVAIWRGTTNEFDEETNELFESIWKGYSVDGQRLVPDKEIVRRYVLPSIFDLVSILCLVGDSPSRIVPRISKGFYNGLIPTAAFRYIIKKNLRVDNSVEPISVFFPFVLGVSYVVEVVNELRRSGYRGEININVHHVLNIPNSFEGYLHEIINDDHTAICCSKNSWDFEDWPLEQNIIVAIPPFKLFRSLVESFRREKIFVPDCWTSFEKAIFAIFDKSRQSLVDNGKLLVTCPNYILESPELFQERERLSSFMRFEKLVNLGSNIDGLSPTSVTWIKASKKNGDVNNRQVKIQWCKNDGDGFFEAMRNQNKILSGAPADNQDIVEYGIPEIHYRWENWAPRPYSENIIIESIAGKINTRDLVPVNSLFNVKNGVRTGFRQVFIIASEEYVKLTEIEKTYFSRVANRQNMRSGKLLDEWYLFYPYSMDVTLLTEASLLKVLPTYGQKLKQYKDVLKSRKIDSKKSWWDLSYRMKYHDPGTPRIVSSDLLTNECIFAYDSMSNYVVTNGFQWVAKKNSISNEHMQYAYLALFCSEFFRKLLQIYCGAYKFSSNICRLTKSSIDSIPIPDLSSNAFLDIVPELSELGMLISHGGVGSIDKNRLNNKIEAVYYELS